MRTLNTKKDPLGHAVADFQQNGHADDILVTSDIAEDDVIPSAYLFRELPEMPELEQIALDAARGRVMDVGAAAGSHSLELQERGFEVTALEYSGRCVEVMQQRGVLNPVCENYFHYKEEGFDTLLCLMNGIGIAGTLSGLEKFLSHARNLLRTGGQILFDSSDISYLYTEEDGGMWVDLNGPYYGELTYQMHYKGISGQPFPWLFVDFDTLVPLAEKMGFEAELLAEGAHFDYLGRMVWRE